MPSVTITVDLGDDEIIVRKSADTLDGWGGPGQNVYRQARQILRDTARVVDATLAADDPASAVGRSDG